MDKNMTLILIQENKTPNSLVPNLKKQIECCSKCNITKLSEKYAGCDNYHCSCHNELS